MFQKYECLISFAFFSSKLVDVNPDEIEKPALNFDLFFNYRKPQSKSNQTPIESLTSTRVKSDCTVKS
jgi:hypothetical protein